MHSEVGFSEKVHSVSNQKTILKRGSRPRRLRLPLTFNPLLGTHRQKIKAKASRFERHQSGNRWMEKQRRLHYIPR